MPYSTLTGILRLPKYRKVEAEMNEKAMELLKVFDLDKEADFLASNLPYGKQRKLRSPVHLRQIQNYYCLTNRQQV